jgi:carboxylesterase type B
LFPSLPAANISAQYFRASRMKRDAEFSCPTLYMAQMSQQYSTSHTTNYLFALNQTLFRPMYAAVNVSYLGVSHFSDIPYVFNQAQSQGYALYASAEELALSSEISGSWAAFAAFGYPSHGNGTIAGWAGLVSASAGTAKGEYHLQVIGGPGTRTRTIEKAQGEYEDLATGCAFWTSEEVVAQLQV